MPDFDITSTGVEVWVDGKKYTIKGLVCQGDRMFLELTA